MKLWKRFTAAWEGCCRCKIGRWAENRVLGVGHIPADVMFIGEGPGKSEDALGEPFVGPAGRLLRKARQSAGAFVSNRCFFTNLVACRPCDNAAGPNRTPTWGEITKCRTRLEKTIDIVKPKVIITLGATPTGVMRRYGSDVVLFSLYHPAYVSRKGGVGSPAFKDYVRKLKQVKRRVDEILKV